jgi:hypothetical protein
VLQKLNFRDRHHIRNDGFRQMLWAEARRRSLVPPQPSLKVFWDEWLRPSMSERRFPPPWAAEERDSCFVVRDANGQPLSYIYFQNGPEPLWAPKLLSKDEARSVAVKIAKLPGP